MKRSNLNFRKRKVWRTFLDYVHETQAARSLNMALCQCMSISIKFIFTPCKAQHSKTPAPSTTKWMQAGILSRRILIPNNSDSQHCEKPALLRTAIESAQSQCQISILFARDMIMNHRRKVAQRCLNVANGVEKYGVPLTLTDRLFLSHAYCSGKLNI